MTTVHEEIIDIEFDEAETDLGPVRSAAIEQVQKPKAHSQNPQLIYLLLPCLFLLVTLLGGMRLGAADSAFIFLKPALICLVFASVLMILFFRSSLLQMDGWFSDGFSTLQNIANAAVLLTMFTASTQLLNSLLPEKGLPFWIVGFCFFWTLWNNLFADFDTKKLLRSLGALFGLAFAVKYLVLANLTATGDTSLLQRIFDNPAKEAFTWMLDLPRYSAGTGYIQFFAVAIYLIALFLTPSTTKK
ncbi:MAG: hypothetical protein IPK98_01145 [Chloracidobacterium sp.]|nr:hypothetical protein [Chloracidobacterium sp.]